MGTTNSKTTLRVIWEIVNKNNSHRNWKFGADISDIYEPTMYRLEV